MSWPVPQPGLVIRYSYLWEHEAREGREEGVKDRPCAIVLVLLRDGDAPVVRVLPITHAARADPADALEIPLATKQRLGLDSDRSWVVLTEANDFIWPGPDLRPAVSGDPSSVAYGMLPPGFMKVLRCAWSRGGKPSASGLLRGRNEAVDQEPRRFFEFVM